MALLFMDGFEAGDFKQKWDAWTGTPTLAAGRFGGTSLWPGGSGMIKKSFPAATKIIYGYAHTTSASWGGTAYPSSQIYSDTGATNHLLIAHSSGFISVYRGGTQIAAVASPEAINIWQYIEVSATISDTVGNVVVRVNGVELINFTGDTKNGGTATTMDMVQFVRPSGGQNNGFDDIYLCNDTGSTNNAFLGDVRVQTLVPNGAGSSAQFTPTGSANNWDNVDELPFSTADFNTSATSGNRDLYTLSDLAAGTATIKAVQHSLVARKNDAGARSIKTAVKSGGTVYTGAAAALGATDVTVTTVRETDPATSAAWTVSAVNALEAGAEVV